MSKSELKKICADIWRMNAADNGNIVMRRCRVKWETIKLKECVFLS